MQVDGVALLSHNGGTLVAACSQLDGNTWGGELRVCDPGSGAATASVPTACGCSDVVAFSEGLGCAAVAGDDGSVTLWRHGTGASAPLAVVAELREHDDIVSRVACNPAQPHMIASASWDGR